MSVTNTYHHRIHRERQKRIANWMLCVIVMICVGFAVVVLLTLAPKQPRDRNRLVASNSSLELLSPPTASRETLSHTADQAAEDETIPAFGHFELAFTAAEEAFDKGNYLRAWKISNVALRYAISDDQKQRLLMLRRSLGPNLPEKSF